MEILVLNSLVKSYRNSISFEGLSLTFSKLIYWNTGRWGNEPGELFNSGLLSWER